MLFLSDAEVVCLQYDSTDLAIDDIIKYNGRPHDLKAMIVEALKPYNTPSNHIMAYFVNNKQVHMSIRLLYRGSNVLGGGGGRGGGSIILLYF